MTTFVRFFFAFTTVLALYNGYSAVRNHSVSDAIAAVGFAMMAWGWWRNPQGFKDEYGVDRTRDARAKTIGLTGAAVVIASIAYDFIAAMVNLPR